MTENEAGFYFSHQGIEHGPYDTEMAAQAAETEKQAEVQGSSTPYLHHVPVMDQLAMNAVVGMLETVTDVVKDAFSKDEEPAQAPEQEQDTSSTVHHHYGDVNIDQVNVDSMEVNQASGPEVDRDADDLMAQYGREPEPDMDKDFDMDK